MINEVAVGASRFDPTMAKDRYRFAYAFETRYDPVMGWRSLVLAWLVLPACSFVFVRDLDEAAHTNPQMPLDCTSSMALPAADLAIGAILGGLVAATTYRFIQEANEGCATDGACFGTTGPVLLGTFLVVSPWWISSAVGFSDTGRCRKAFRARGFEP